MMMHHVGFLLLFGTTIIVDAFSTGNLGAYSISRHYHHQHEQKQQSSTTTLFAVATKGKKQTRKSKLADVEVQAKEMEEMPAGVEGAQFFGGNKQKEELYDAEAEAKAGTEGITVVSDGNADVSEQYYNRFQDELAFPTPIVKSLGLQLQNQINQVLYDDAGAAPPTDNEYSYATKLDWSGCFQTSESSNPLIELEKTLDFYRRVDVVITSGRQLKDNTVEIDWQISVMWPIFWEPRILLSGTSTLTIGDSNKIIKQVDELAGGNNDLLSVIGSQLSPRFWDVYHIGMTPSAELATRYTVSSPLLAQFKVYDLPSRLVLTPSQTDSLEERENCNAQILPNFAFSCIIKTVGSQRQRYIPTSPVEVQIKPKPETNGELQLRWTIPLAVEFQTNAVLPVPHPSADPECPDDIDAQCRYEFQPKRRVATIPYGGNPQDSEISKVRKKLYDQVSNSGDSFKPKLDENGRPQFFFIQNAVKTCFTEEGLGMSVYEWRPEFVKFDEVGIELESS